MTDMVVEQTDGDLLKGVTHSGYLCQDVDALDVVLDHLRQPTYLALDPFEPLEHVLLVVAITVGRHGSHSFLAWTD